MVVVVVQHMDKSPAIVSSRYVVMLHPKLERDALDQKELQVDAIL